ncbi:MAG: hypothetical protein U0361_15505 [Nitrospiraceae bacterium]
MIRDRIDGLLQCVGDVEGASEREEARMAVVMLCWGSVLAERRDPDRASRGRRLGCPGKRRPICCDMIGDVRAVEPLMKRLQVDKDAA